MALDYASLLDRIMVSDDKDDPDELTELEENYDEITARLQNRKLPSSDPVVQEVSLAVSARLRLLGV